MVKQKHTPGCHAETQIWSIWWWTQIVWNISSKLAATSLWEEAQAMSGSHPKYWPRLRLGSSGKLILTCQCWPEHQNCHLYQIPRKLWAANWTFVKLFDTWNLQSIVRHECLRIQMILYSPSLRGWKNSCAGVQLLNSSQKSSKLPWQLLDECSYLPWGRHWMRGGEGERDGGLQNFLLLTARIASSSSKPKL